MSRGYQRLILSLIPDVRTFEVLERRQESRTVVLPELDLAPRLPRVSGLGEEFVKRQDTDGSVFRQQTTTAATTTDTANNGDAAVEEAAEDVDDAQETNRAAAGGKRPKRNESSGPRKQ